MTASLQRHAKEAVKQFAGSVTVPILYPMDGQLVPIGTGVFLSVQSRLFIVTAAHLFSGQQLDKFYVPTGRVNAKATRIRGTLIREKDPNKIDIAIIELLTTRPKICCEKVGTPLASTM
ncbi:MAG: hypothetical protein ABL864_13650 [Terricaulis sp.]